MTNLALLLPSSPEGDLIAALESLPTRRYTPPHWLDLTILPSLQVGGGTLTSQAVLGLVVALQQSTPTEPHPIIDRIRRAADLCSLEQFLWELAERWEANSAPSTSRWVFLALGLLGNDTIALRLAERIPVWREQQKYQRVTAAMQCMAAIGTDAALHRLGIFADQEEYQSLETRALTELDTVAAARGITREQLRYRIVPRFGLDDLSTLLTVGPRLFTPALNEELVPALRDQGGKLHRSLPQDRGDLDRGSTVERWKVLRKAMAQEIRTQTSRLEEAMIAGYRWTADEWAMTIVGHPLWAALARKLLWVGHSADGVLQEAFSISNDQSLVNEDYLTVSLSSYAAIGLAHPVQVSYERRSRWANLLYDFQISPLFPQGDRPVYELRPEECEMAAITRLQKLQLTGRDLKRLRRRQWRSGGYERVGSATHLFYFRMFPGHQTIAMVSLTYPDGYGDGMPVQVGACSFVEGPHLTAGSFSDGARLPLHQIDPVVISETIADWMSGK
jgi:hypothetical protein